jgi:hypothetical protein
MRIMRNYNRCFLVLVDEKNIDEFEIELLNANINIENGHDTYKDNNSIEHRPNGRKRITIVSETDSNVPLDGEVDLFGYKFIERK